MACTFSNIGKTNAANYRLAALVYVDYLIADTK